MSVLPTLRQAQGDKAKRPHHAVMLSLSPFDGLRVTNLNSPHCRVMLSLSPFDGLRVTNLNSPHYRVMLSLSKHGPLEA